MASGDERVANLWLAEELWTLGGVQFGDFSLGETVVNSPVYVNLRRLISNPEALRHAAERDAGRGADPPGHAAPAPGGL